MSKSSVDTFALVINYLNECWMPQHVIIGLFEVHETTRLSMAGQLRSLLEKHDLMHRMITFVKDEGNNLMSMATTLCSIVDCHLLKLQRVCEGMCFGHIMFKTCQYVTNDEKVIIGLKQVNVKATQGNLQKIIAWTKKSGKGKQEWEKACVEKGLWFQKLKTLVKTRFSSKVIMFKEVLEIKEPILLC